MSDPYLFNGALAGFTATIPMTVAMEAMHQSLPQRERYPLPPREITEKITNEVSTNEYLSESGRFGLTMLSHFTYGAAAGVVYASIAQRYHPSPVWGGVTFGLALWAGSYLGWLPATGVLRPATEHPPRRNALMVTAHIIWGATAGILVDCLRDQG
jgi:uncharacterized membrane protein YagU involved in acid resistance